MKKILLIIIVAALSIYEAVEEQGSSAEAKVVAKASKAKQVGSLQAAFANRQSDLQIQGVGIVKKVLRDDLKGSKHQKFILRVSGQTVLVAHNIDLAPRIGGLRAGDRVEFYGEYEWNDRGGVIHWTHRDPQRRHASGWLKHNGKTYQ
ncbi:MAG: hypothetical protein methR_P3362 [Methyloprofundus sp.]|nr:MAG: hypothetical protein methR_P3362 [Methyloprofundus sp.]